MPRLDNTSETVIRMFDLSLDPDDPGDTPPVDLCEFCWQSWEGTGLDIDHPPYEDVVYNCLECGIDLTEADN